MQYLVGSLRYLIEPEFALIAEVEGKVAGAAIGLPDYNPRYAKSTGDYSRLDSCDYCRGADCAAFCVLSLTVAPEYQRWGLGLVLLQALLPKALELGFSEAEFSWISETNTLAIGGMRKAGLRHSRDIPDVRFRRGGDRRTRPASGSSVRCRVLGTTPDPVGTPVRAD